MVFQNLRRKPGSPGGLMQKKGKIPGGHDKIDWKSKGGQLQKNWYPQHGGTIFFSGKVQLILCFPFLSCFSINRTVLSCSCVQENYSKIHFIIVSFNVCNTIDLKTTTNRTRRQTLFLPVMKHFHRSSVNSNHKGWTTKWKRSWSNWKKSYWDWTTTRLSECDI